MMSRQKSTFCEWNSSGILVWNPSWQKHSLGILDLSPRNCTGIPRDWEFPEIGNSPRLGIPRDWEFRNIKNRLGNPREFPNYSHGSKGTIIQYLDFDKSAIFSKCSSQILLMHQYLKFSLLSNDS
jgi:hypothetical protein